MRDLIILGSGPAGLTAALYTARAKLSPLVITGNEIGGQLSLTTEVDNYPGFPEGATGPELIDLMTRQAERFGTEFDFDEATEVDLSQHPFWIKTHGGEHRAKALIVATGASPRRLGVPGEEKFTGRGVSYCAACDGFFYQGKEVVVVGGGDSALEEGLFLTKFASRVRVVHRRDQLRAGPLLQERAGEDDKIEFIWNSVVTEIVGEEGVEAVQLENVQTGERSILPTGGVFIYIGQIPNSDLFKGQLEMDERGYILTDRRKHTNVVGVFAAGEVEDSIFQQVVTCAGAGCKAAMEAEKFLAELEDRTYPG